MCTTKYHGDGPRGLLMLRLFIGRIQRSFDHFLEGNRGGESSDFDEEFEVPTPVPDDVKEGHFAVLAVAGEERKRFVVKIEYLTSPALLRLLKQAEEEYGFQQMGAIAVPCRAEELQKILKL